MNKSEAIKWIKDIQSGSGFDLSEIDRDVLGGVAEMLISQQNAEFGYGVEYGIMHSLMVAFDIKPSDLWKVAP